MSQSGDELSLETAGVLADRRGQYTPEDRYRDFRRVFFDTPEGKRALNEILGWCHLLRPSLFGKPIDPYAVVALEAERNLGLRLLKAINNEPARPRQERKSDG